MATDKSILEIDTADIQGHYNGNNISYDDLVKFTESKVSDSPVKQNIVNEQGFYISQADYIEYQIAKREGIKSALRRKKFGNNILLVSIWLLKTIISIFLFCFVCYGFYMLCWTLQRTF